MKYDLQFPIEHDGKTISSVTVRRPKGRDMVALGDHFPSLAKFDGKTGNTTPDAAAFRAMVAVVGTLADLGEEVAGELDLTDLQAITVAAFANLGESQGRGKARSGGGR